jgi:hypothetical protein
MSESDLAAQRKAIREALLGGLQTQWRERAYDDVDVRSIVAELQSVAVDCLEDKLRIAGFTLSPHVSEIEPEIEQACRTCMYYESHRKYCNLPELKLGVEPEWSCILWRV